MQQHRDTAPGSAVAKWAASDRYATLAGSIDEGFCVIEMLFDGGGRPVDYRFVEVNPSFERQTGLAGAVGRRMLELAPSHESFWAETYGRVALTGDALRFDHEAGALGRWFDVFAFRVGMPGEHLVGVLFNEISDRVHAQRALQLADRRKNDFMAVLAHELRNPLAPMRVALHLVQSARKDPTLLDRAVAVMQRQIDQMAKLVDELTDVGRISRGEVVIDRAPVDLRDVVAHAVETAQPMFDQSSHAFELALPDAPVIVCADAGRLAQALGNLLINAGKYTPPGGHVALALRAEAAQALLVVSDDGIGIPAHRLADIFEMFAQDARGKALSRGGLGIGLALVREIVQRHGGSVEARSDGPGRGSAFVVTLPLAEAA